MSYLKRLNKDLQKKQETTSEPKEFEEIGAAMKCTDIMLEVLQAYHSCGLNSPLFASTWDQQHHFSQLNPKVSWPFPKWLSIASLENKLLIIDSPARFWEQLSEDNLIVHAIPDMALAQSKVLSEKVALVSSRETTTVLGLQSFFSFPAEADYKVCAELQSQAVSVHLIAHHAVLTYMQEDALNAAILSTKESKHIVSHALTLYPGGRALVEAAVGTRAMLLLTKCDIVNISKYAGALRNINNSSEHDEASIEALMDLNRCLFHFDQAENVSNHKSVVEDKCRGLVFDVSNDFIDIVLKISQEVFPKCLANGVGDDYDSLHWMFENITLCTSLYSARWGWRDIPKWRALAACIDLDILLWNFPDFDLKKMKQESVVEVLGILAAARATKGELVQVFGEDFGAKFDTWQSSEHVTSFQLEACAIVNDMVDSSLTPFQDLGSRSKLSRSGLWPGGEGRRSQASFELNWVRRRHPPGPPPVLPNLQSTTPPDTSPIFSPTFIEHLHSMGPCFLFLVGSRLRG